LLKIRSTDQVILQNSVSTIYVKLMFRASLFACWHNKNLYAIFPHI